MSDDAPSAVCTSPDAPYALAGAALVAYGFSAIPISPADKMPGRYSGGQWYPMKEWSRYCGTLPTGFEVKLWSGWPSANVGVACGRGLLAFDIDREDLVEPIKAVLPPCIVAKRGRKGETLFYRGDTGEIRSRGFKIDKKGVLDLIADGKQTVVPPSIHPDTLAPYVWTTPRTLLDTPLADLTEATAEHVEAVIEVLRAHGYEPPETIRAIERDGYVCGDSAEGIAEWFRRLNEDALANLDAWVPRLGLTRLARSGDGYRSVAEWRPSGDGKPIGRRRMLLSIDPKGIVDYGDGDKGYTPLNLVMAAHDIPEADLSRAAKWLGEAIGYDFSPRMVLNRNRKTASPLEEAARLYRAAQDGDAEPAAPVAAAEPMAPAGGHPGAMAKAVAEAPNVHALPDPDEAAEREPMTRNEEMRELVHCPGLVGDLVDWICSTNDTPDPVLAFSAALAFVGTLAGRNYESETNLRTNIYTFGLAKSGFGKDHARKCIRVLTREAGLSRFLGGDSIASGTGMRKRVEAQPSILWIIDEFGGFMREINNSKMPHSFQIRDMLLRMYGSAATVYAGTDYAGEQAIEIHNPNVCLYGTSTPVDFWNSCRALSAADGLLARFLIFTVNNDVLPPEVEPTQRFTQPPRSLIERLQRLSLPKIGGNLNGRLSDGTTKSEPLLVPFESDARDCYRSDKSACRKRAHEAAEDEASLWNRTAENAMKIAMILAIGADVERPVIRKGMMEQGFRIAELCTLTTLDQIAGRLADNDRQREHVDVKRWIMEAGREGLTRTQISKRVNGRFDRRRLDDILASLEKDSKEVVCVVVEASGPGRRGARYFSTSVLSGVQTA